MLKKLLKIIVEYRVAFGLIAIFLLILSFYGMTKLSFESDLSKQLSENLKAAMDYYALQDEFQSGDVAIIIVKVNSIEEGCL